jgi:hypothetical protein
MPMSGCALWPILTPPSIVRVALTAISLQFLSHSKAAQIDGTLRSDAEEPMMNNHFLTGIDDDKA